GTANGLVMFDSSAARRRVITHDDGLIANQVTDVVLRPDGSAVAATPAGVSFIDASGISSIYAFQGLVNTHAYALGADGTRTRTAGSGVVLVAHRHRHRARFVPANAPLQHSRLDSILRPPDEPRAGWFVRPSRPERLRMDNSDRLEPFDDLPVPLQI